MDITLIIISIILLLELIIRVLNAIEVAGIYSFNISSIIQSRISNSKALYFKSHPYALYTKVPNASGLYPSNNFGYVGTNNLKTVKDKNTVRIYCVGGSTLQQHDTDLGENSSWPSLMGDLINSSLKSSSRIIEVINAGTSAYTSAESLSEFMFNGLELKPDYLLIYHNVNDAWQAQMIDGFKSDYSHARKHNNFNNEIFDKIPSMPYFLCLHITLRLFVKVFGARNSLVYKISNPPWESVEPFDKGRINAFRRNINNLIAIAKHNDIKPIIVKWVCDWDSEIVPAYFSKSNSADLSNKFKNYLLANNQVLEELASQNGVPYFDPGEFNSDCFSDKMHFNKKGLLLMSKRASNFMLRTII